MTPFDLRIVVCLALLRGFSFLLSKSKILLFYSGMLFASCSESCDLSGDSLLSGLEQRQTAQRFFQASELKQGRFSPSAKRRGTEDRTAGGGAI